MAVTLFPKKISTATMGLTASVLDTCVSNTDGPVSVLRVWGIVSGKTNGVSQFGSYSKFSGEIAALNLVNNEEARSQGLLLPQVAETVVASLYEKACKDGSSAQIALEVTVELNNLAKGGCKYRFGVKPLIEFKCDDALTAMAKSLPAPKLLTLKKK